MHFGVSRSVVEQAFDQLLAEGYAVICVDNLLTGRRENIAHLEDDPRFRQYWETYHQLMGRHGECVAIASLSRKLPELGRSLGKSIGALGTPTLASIVFIGPDADIPRDRGVYEPHGLGDGGSSRDAELLFHVLDELRELQDGHLADLFQNLSAFHLHVL